MPVEKRGTNALPEAIVCLGINPVEWGIFDNKCVSGQMTAGINFWGT
jgi:hypothetical protein